MLTKAQKKEHVSAGGKLITGSKAIIFADFTGAPTKEVNKLKNELKKSGATMKVFKKRLLKIALKDAGITVDMLDNKAPVATVFSPDDLTSVAGPIYKFAKDLAKSKIEFKVLGAFDREGNRAIPVAEFNVIARLPSREVLLAQVIGTMSGPLRKFMIALQEIAKSAQGGSASGGKEPASAEPTAPAAA
jgi:large subunit ribosomal protein L10